MSGQLMFWGSPAVVSLMNQMTLGVMGANNCPTRLMGNVSEENKAEARLL